MSLVGNRVRPLLLALGLLLGNAFPALAAEPPPLLIIGATAKSSTEIIRQALAAGHRVTGLARRPEDVTQKAPGLTVVKGDVYDPASLEAAMTGQEVVISMISPRVDPTDTAETPASFDLFTTGTTNILNAMKKKGNRRLLVASSLGVEDPFPTVKPAPGDFRAGWLWKSRHLYKNMKDMEGIVRASGLEYVIFRPPFLVEEPARNDVRLSIDADSPKGSMMTYADFGAFVLAQADGREHLGQAVGMYTDRPLKFGQNADFQKLAKEAKEKFDRANGK
ncbi:MAG: NAD(P)H-binding protein [Gammaproteobacteria bacterium]|nr:NAD(P)H-binding protein [Gammaproteobacteria bacterium]